MKFTFPQGLYADVRIEHSTSTAIRYTKTELNECKVREYAAAFIRIFDGEKWYYASTSDLGAVQKEIDNLATLAKPDKNIGNNETVKRMSRAVDTVLVFEKNKLTAVPLEEKAAFLNQMHPFAKDETIKLYFLIYADQYKLKEFYNSLGAAVKHDYQLCGFALSVSMSEGERKFDSAYMKSSVEFAGLKGFEKELTEELASFKEFLKKSEPVEPGKYTMIFSPEVTGVFTHEIFGHKSEADGMVGDEATKNEWVIGKTMGIPELNIIDEGTDTGSGYAVYDDEGHKARRNYIIKNGKLTGRLHSAATAADFGEEVTGNARALNYEFEPIVRMTNTYIDKGTKSFDGLLKDIKKGIYIKKVAHGSGLSTFTIAPTMSYMIEDGKITRPVRISVITGSVFETLGDIDAIGSEVEIRSGIFGGCGKMAQGPLPVANGGPCIRVKNMTVN